jgi:cellulose synthase (UDP-forming)
MELSHYRRNLEVIAISAIISISVYFFVRILSFLYIPGIAPVLIIYGMFFLLAESFSIIHLMGFIIDIFHINKRKPKKFNFKNIPAGHWPSVAVLLPAKDEPKEVLEETIASLNLLDYENKNIYLLDGSDKEYFIDTSKKLAEYFKINYFRSKNIKNGKAGVINDFLSQMKEEYLAIFDADQKPMPSFLKETVAIAEYDKKIAFVQTPQFYSNVKTSTIARGAAFQQAIFFESICEAKGTVGSMFCCGTNVLLKKNPLLEVGGFDERSITEDFATSIKIHLKGYKSIYYNHVRAFGMAPQNLAAYFSQQARWSTGTASVLPKIFKYFLAGPDRMTLNQWWEYFLSSSFYFVGWTFLILMMGPILFLILDLPVSFINPIYYIIAFVPYYIATSAVFYEELKSIKEV